MKTIAATEAAMPAATGAGRLRSTASGPEGSGGVDGGGATGSGRGGIIGPRSTGSDVWPAAGSSGTAPT